MFEPQFTGPERPVFTEVSRKKTDLARALEAGMELSGFADSGVGSKSRKGFSRSK